MDDYDKDFVNGLRAELKLKRKHIEELETAIAFAHGRLESDVACPPSNLMAHSLRMLADERAGWIEVAVDHNKQCKQLKETSW